MNDIRAAALAYAARFSWKVFPCFSVEDDGRCRCQAPTCDSPGKHPMIAGGFKAATTDPATITKWWEQWPEANVAAATGARSGFDALDVDPPLGPETVADLEKAHGTLPETVESITGKLGRHLLFAHAPGLGSRIGALTGVDVKADAGYVVLPPSRHKTGRRYAWEGAHRPGEVAIADWPVWLLSILAPSAKRRTADGPVDVAATLAGVPEGKRDWQLYRLAAKLRAADVPEAEAVDLLTKAALAAIPPFPVDLAIEKVRRVYRQFHPGRPWIHVTSEAADIVDCAEDALIDAGIPIYQRGRLLVRVVRDGARNVPGLARAPGSPAIVPCDEPHLAELMAMSASWRKHDARSRKLAPCLPPQWAVRMHMSRNEWRFPPLEAVSESPILRPDGSVCMEPGYDPETAVLFDPGETVFPPLPEHPTLDDAHAALDVLSEPFSEFPFLAPEDRAAALAAILTAVGRSAIRGPAPLFALRATCPGTGKTLLADCISLIATGRTVPRMTAPRGDDEVRKRVTAIALEGIPIVLIDNHSGPFGSDTWSAAFTADRWKDRLLGSSRVVEAPLRPTWLLTGNGVSFRGDTGRRVIACDMDAEIERPERRTGFVHDDLRAYVRNSRPQLVTAALTILSAYTEAGRPDHGQPVKASFEEWDQIIRGALLWAGTADPERTADRVREEGDTDTAALQAALLIWRETFDQPTTAAAAVERAKDHAELAATLAEFCQTSTNKLDATTLGYRLRSRAGRIAGGLRFARDGTTAGAIRWRVDGTRGDGRNGGDSFLTY